MREIGGETKTGSAALGILQSLGVYLLGVVVFGVTVASRPRYPGALGTPFEVIGAGSAGVSLALGVWQSRRGRGRTASGVIAGTFLWPAIAFGLGLWAVMHALTHARIPF